ncbi:TadE family type IV pilus minor pilin [Terrabacter sp. C0L_2]|uniref:TadE family type IV pilus minor pilin n=1 Tax=Terrabacter sp. C0L_2 TaxID=3108389 RepID=UPI002ED55360|nr:TadE family type IV pilus minor pilin [Terrabacter sp. C0L_2]
MVTAELAVAIPSVVLVLALCLVAAKAGVDQIRCVDAARVASRAAARGDDPARVRALASASAPAGANVRVEGSASGGGDAGGGVRVTVSVRTGGWGALPGWELSASAVTPVESAP